MRWYPPISVYFFALSFIVLYLIQQSIPLPEAYSQSNGIIKTALQQNGTNKISAGNQYITHNDPVLVEVDAIKDGLLYQINYKATPELFETNYVNVRKIIDSFQIVDLFK